MNLIYFKTEEGHNWFDSGMTIGDSMLPCFPPNVCQFLNGRTAKINTIQNLPPPRLTTCLGRFPVPNGKKSLAQPYHKANTL
eukprot:scaffold294450_cov35-Attheya_sp.AAC.1